MRQVFFHIDRIISTLQHPFQSDRNFYMKDFKLIRLLTDYLVHENNMFCRSCKMFSTFIFSHSGLCLYAGLQLNQRPRFLPHCVLPVSLCTYMLLLASDQMHHYSLISDICILVPESVWERETVCNWMKTKVRLNCVDGCFFKSDFCDQMCYEPDVVLLWLCFTPNLQPSVNENVCVCVSMKCLLFLEELLI